MGKRKSNAKSGTGSNYRNDLRASEKELVFTERYFAGKTEPSTAEIGQQLDNFLKGIIPTDYQANLTKAQLAQDKAYDAFATSGKNGRVRLAKEALAISEDCPDAYLILAEDDAKTVHDAIPLLRKGLAAGKRLLGEEAFVLHRGEFHKRLFTRPYLRTLFSLAECLTVIDEFDEAIDLYKEALQLDASDYYEAKSTLIPVLVAAEKYTEALSFIEQHGVRSTRTLYSKALASFALHGDTIQSQDALKAAIMHNSYVIGWLTEFRESKPHAGAEPGSDEEASSYVFEAMASWISVEGALAWMVKSLTSTITRKTIDDVFPGLRNVAPEVIWDPEEVMDDAISDVIGVTE
jgi:tetratricopeptide (TPR) repeat protein